MLGRDKDQMQATDAIYVMGGLEKSQELMNLAYMYLGEGAPYNAAIIIEKGMKAKKIERSDKNLDVLAIVLSQAKNYDKVMPVLIERVVIVLIPEMHTAGLVSTYLDLDMNKEVDAGLTAIKKGNAKNSGEIYTNSGYCLYGVKEV